MLKKWLGKLLILAILVGISDFLAFPILKEIMFKGEGVQAVALRETFLYFVVGLGGALSLRKISLQDFFAADAKKKKKAGVLAGALVVANTIFYFITVTKYNNQIFTNLLEDNLLASIGIALRSGITEELIFRFFLINSILFIGSGIMASPSKLKVVAITLSSMAFVLIHPLNSALITLTAGVILGYIYFAFGLFGAVLTHILSNLVPFLLIALKLIT